MAYLGLAKGGGRPARGSGGRKSPSGVQGQSPDRRYGGRSPPETERFFEIDMNFDGFGAKLNAKITDSVPKNFLDPATGGPSPKGPPKYATE